jgi:hypothetical protein
MIIDLNSQHRFWKYVERSNGCWLWTGCLNDSGYGIFRFEGRNYRATHISLWIYNRPVPQGLCALHKCDNPACVNPDHLYIGDKGQNIQDSYNRGRRPRIDVGDQNRGSRNGMSKLTETDVIKIKQRIQAGETNKDIAAEFGVNSSTISEIKSGRTWKEV